MERAGFTPGGIGAIRRYRSPAAPGTSRQGVVGTGALTMGQWKVLGGRTEPAAPGHQAPSVLLSLSLALLPALSWLA